MRVFASKVLTLNGWEHNKTLVIENGSIIEILDGNSDATEVISGSIIPGMVNLHSHAFQKAFVGLTEYRTSKSDSFWSWRDAMYRLLSRVSPEDLNTIAQYLYIEMLKQGYTSVAEFHYLHHQYRGQHYDEPAINSHSIIDAALNVGIAICHCPVFYSFSDFNCQPPSEEQKTFVHNVEEFQRLLEHLKHFYREKDNVSFGIAPHSLRAVSQDQLVELTQWWQGEDKTQPIHIHISEQMKEVNASVEFYGKRPVHWLLDKFDVNESWCLVHATHLEKLEISLLANSKAVAGLCPETEGNLGDGIFPGADYIEAGGRIGIGSDSHIAVSPWRELRTLEYSQRFQTQRRNIFCDENMSSVGEYLWRRCAIEAAPVVQRQCGEIKVGHKADLVVLDESIPELSSVDDQQRLSAAIFASNENPVQDVMVNGNWVVRNKRHSLEGEALMKYTQFLKDKVNVL